MPITLVLDDHYYGDSWAGLSIGPILIGAAAPEVPMASCRMQFINYDTGVIGYEYSSEVADDKGSMTITNAATWCATVPKQGCPLTPGRWRWTIQIVDDNGDALTVHDGILKVTGIAGAALPTNWELATTAQSLPTALEIADLTDSTSPSLLTVAETSGKIISNYQVNAADHEFVMPTAHENGRVRFVIGQEQQIDITPASGANFYLNGTALATDESIQNTADVLGEEMEGYVANIDGTLTWMFNSASANFVGENA